MNQRNSSAPGSSLTEKMTIYFDLITQTDLTEVVAPGLDSAHDPAP